MHCVIADSTWRIIRAWEGWAKPTLGSHSGSEQPRRLLYQQRKQTVISVYIEEPLSLYE
jgi:hypothetical protein